jgi:imidazolonepropionase-like amidohydrolase
MTDEVIEKLVASGIPLCPTLTMPANTAQFGEMVGANPRRVYYYAQHMERSARVLERARQAGVTFMAGTDSGFSLTPYGEWHARELELLVDYVGCTPLEAIKAGTSTAAKALNLAGEVGVVAPGMLADVLVVDGDPLRDIKVLQDHSRLHAIVKDGQPIDLGAPWPERTVWPFERAQIVSTVDLTWERVQGRPAAEADLRERLAGTAVRATGGF